MEERAALLLQEYQEVNAHLRSNTSQFVNWFSIFLALSLMSAAVFMAASGYRSTFSGFAYRNGIQLVSLLLHVPAFIGILTFRHYIAAAERKIQMVTQELGQSGDSPIPARFCQWMTDLMAGGYVVSYFIWFSLLFLP